VGSGGKVGGGGSVGSWNRGCNELFGTSALLGLTAPCPLPFVGPLASVLLAWPLSAVPTMPMHARLLQGPVVLTALVPLMSVVEAISLATTVLSEVVTLVLVSLLLLLLWRVLLLRRVLLRRVLLLVLLEVVCVVGLVFVMLVVLVLVLVLLLSTMPVSATSLCELLLLVEVSAAAAVLLVAAELPGLRTTVVDEFWSW